MDEPKLTNEQFLKTAKWLGQKIFDLEFDIEDLQEELKRKKQELKDMRQKLVALGMYGLAYEGQIPIHFTDSKEKEKEATVTNGAETVTIKG